MTLLKTVHPHIRLETLESTAVRSILCCTYTTLVVAIGLTALTELGFARKHVEFNVTRCFDDEDTPQNKEITLNQGDGCYRPCTASGSRPWDMAWTAIAGNIDDDAGKFSMTLRIKNVNATSDGIDTAMSFVSTLYGSSRAFGGRVSVTSNGSCALRSGDDTWAEAFQGRVHSNVRLKCDPAHDCPRTNIFDSTTTSWGRSKGGFESYLVNSKFSFTDENFDFIQNNAEKAVMDFSYERPAFRAFVIGTRGTLALLTLVFLLVWVHLTNKYYHSGHPDPGICANAKQCCCHLEFWNTWLPQRRWVFWMTVAMIWWQNPVFVITQIMGESSVLTAVITESISSASWGLVFIVWLMMADGLRQPDPYRTKFPLSFYVPKIVFYAFYTFIIVALHVIRKPHFTPSTNESEFGDEDTNEAILDVTLAMAITYIALLFTWSIWFFCSLVKTRKVLTKLPYAQTRFQQLIFRFLMWQTSVVAIFTIAINAIPFFRWIVTVASSGTDDGAGDSDTESRIARLKSLIQDVSEGVQPIGAYILVSVYNYFLLYCYLPPKSSRNPVTMMERLEHGITNFIGTVTGSGTDSNMRPFSFEEACWLFDFAWATYFDPSPNIRIDADAPEAPIAETVKMQTDSSSGDLDPVPHGFSIEGFIYSRRTDTVVIVYRRDWRIVIAFRGTASYKNVLTDVKFTRKAAEFSAADNTQLSAAIPGVRQVLPLIHQGFWNAYISVKQPLHSVLRSSIESAGADAKLYFTGHSLGGALATIAAYDCRKMVFDTLAQQRGTFGMNRHDTSFMGNIRSFFEGMSGSFRRSFSSFTGASRGPNESQGTTLTGTIAYSRETGIANSEETKDSLEDDASQEGGNEKKHRLSVAVRSLPLESCYSGVGIVQPDDDDNTASNVLASGTNGEAPIETENEYDEQDDQVAVYTFGSPRVGNRAFASQYDDRIPWTFRITTDGDMVTGIPKFGFMYKHVGTHVWMDRGGNIIVDPSFVETTFVSRRKTRLDVHSCIAYRQSLTLARIQQGLPLSEQMKKDLNVDDEKQAQIELLGTYARSVIAREGVSDWE